MGLFLVSHTMACTVLSASVVVHASRILVTAVQRQSGCRYALHPAQPYLQVVSVDFNELCDQLLLVTREAFYRSFAAF